MGNRAAIALLASFLICGLLDWSGAQFNFVFWLMMDSAVVLAIIHRTMTYWDVAIIASFIPAWALYLAPDDVRYFGVSVVLVAQFLLTTPDTVRRLKSARKANTNDHDTLRMMLHA